MHKKNAEQTLFAIKVFDDPAVKQESPRFRERYFLSLTALNVEILIARIKLTLFQYVTSAYSARYFIIGNLFVCIIKIFIEKSIMQILSFFAKAHV